MQNTYWRNNKDERRHSLLEKYTSHFIWKVCVWEGVGDRTELQHIDPHFIGHNCVSLPFSWAAQPGAWGPTLLGAGFLCHHLVTNGSGLQTRWLPVFSELYNCSIAHSISPHNWPSRCVSSAVFGMACLIVIERKKLSRSSQVTIFWCISLWLYRWILPCPILSAKPAYAISSHNCYRNVSLPPSLEWHVCSVWRSIYSIWRLLLLS